MTELIIFLEDIDPVVFFGTINTKSLCYSAKALRFTNQ
jgi:hypothetical protein